MLQGLPVHIVQRGNNHARCFFDNEDRNFYLFHLARLLPRTGCALHAYCLMTNHVHLLVTPRGHGACAELMKHMGQLYTQYVNRQQRRSGTLWEGRYKSCIVQAEDYLISCYRYIELNPVRAGICMHPRDYPWSSYGANAGGMPDSRITPHEEFLRLGATPEERRGAYEHLFGSDLDARRVEEIRAATNGNIALGNEAFKERLSSTLGRRAYRGRPGRPGAQSSDGPTLI